MRHILIALALAALPAAQAAPVLDTIVGCPADTACLYTNMFEDAEGTLITGPDGVHVFLALQGRLDGGEPRLYSVQVYSASQSTLPLTPYLGRSPANNPLIQTDRGVLEILNTAQDLAPSNLYVIDANEWKVIDNYLQSTYGDVFFFRSGEPAAVWNDGLQRCISAPVKRPGLLKFTPKSCSHRPKEDEYEVQGDLVPEALQLARIKQLLPALVNDQMGPLTKIAKTFDDGEIGIQFYRIKGTPYVVVAPYYPHPD